MFQDKFFEESVIREAVWHRERGDVVHLEAELANFCLANIEMAELLH